MKKNYLFILPLMVCCAVVKAQQTPATIVITPQSTLKIKDSVLRKQVIDWSVLQFKDNNYKHIKAHPSSDYFPGKVGAGAQLISKTIHLKHQQISAALVPVVSKLDYSEPWNKTLYSTGLYAQAGEYIEVTIPKELAGKGIDVQIGIHSDNLGEWVAATEAWRRMPLVVKRTALTATITRVSSPFGGLIYLTADPKSTSWEADITISHAITSPLYEAGKTSLQEWQAQLQNNKAPWGELVNGNVIITIPDTVLQKVTDPEKVMRLWNIIVTGEMELAQIPQPYYRPQRLVVDEHIGGGFMHSGYPIMIHHSPSVGMLSADIIADPTKLLVPSNGGANWGFFHEIGHNMQNQDWVFGGTTEVTCNLFSLYMFDRLLGGRDKAHSNISNEATQKEMKKYFDGGADYEKWTSNPFLGLILFRQLQEGFGWESFKTFFRKLQELALQDPEGKYAATDQQKKDLWGKYFSLATGRNVVPFFEKWGITISKETAAEVASLPVWMPYNFPMAK